MASSDVDQKFLAAAAQRTAPYNSLASAAFYKILGNSVLLARKLYRARKLRKLDTSRDTKSLSLYQHIIWMSREGLELLDTWVLPHLDSDEFDPETRVLSFKLRASYHHIFCLFHNHPPVSQTANPYYKPTTRSPKTSPRDSSGRRDTQGARSSSSPTTSKLKNGLRDPIDSITSETSFVTNPFSASNAALHRPGPPGLAPSVPPGLPPVRTPQPSAFLLPVMNWLPLTTAYFSSASAYAQATLPGSHPLRLSVALEHSAFLWDCLHDHEGARKMARAAIKDVYRAPESLDDDQFQAAAELVAVLGRMMKRRSWEGTPRPGASPLPPPPPPPSAQTATAAALPSPPSRPPTAAPAPTPAKPSPKTPSPASTRSKHETHHVTFDPTTPPTTARRSAPQPNRRPQSTAARKSDRPPPPRAGAVRSVSGGGPVQPVSRAALGRGGGEERVFGR